MTRRTLYRILIALRFAASGNACAFIYMLPKGRKHRMTVWDLDVMAIMRKAAADNSVYLNDIFQRRPLLAYLRDNCGPLDGGTYITHPLVY